MRVAVIGAGPSGLVTLKYLKTAHHFFPGKPVEAVLFESESVVGGTFAQRTYEDAEVYTPDPVAYIRALHELTEHTLAGLVQVPHSFLRLQGPRE